MYQKALDTLWGIISQTFPNGSIELIGARALLLHIEGSPAKGVYNRHTTDIDINVSSKLGYEGLSYGLHTIIERALSEYPEVFKGVRTVRDITPVRGVLTCGVVFDLNTTPSARVKIDMQTRDVLHGSVASLEDILCSKIDASLNSNILRRSKDLFDIFAIITYMYPSGSITSEGLRESLRSHGVSIPDTLPEVFTTEKGNADIIHAMSRYLPPPLFDPYPDILSKIITFLFGLYMPNAVWMGGSQWMY